MSESEAIPPETILLMNSNELEITRLVTSEDFVPFDLSNNCATLGDNAGQLTWSASKEAAVAIAPALLDTEEKKEAFRDFVKSSGGWSEEEIAAWDDVELNALCLQWIAGDIREAFGDADFAEWDWDEYEKDAEAGRIPSRIFKADDGRVFFDIGS